MYKIIIMMIIISLLSGCGIFNLDGWIYPDDKEFLMVIKDLDTPEKICKYMENFEWNISIHMYSPYQMYLANLEDWNDTGDCDDFATFAMYVANGHNISTYRMTMWVKYIGFYDLPLILPHVIIVYVENDKYTYSNNQIYRPLFVGSFQEIIDDCETYNHNFREIISWKAYDYYNNIIEKGR